MNTLEATRPPVSAQCVDGEIILIVRIKVPNSAIAEKFPGSFLSANNFVAAGCLAVAFQAAFALEEASAMGPLNRSTFIIRTSSCGLGEALERIKTMLRSVSLEQFAVIFHFDEREVILRLLFKGTDTDHPATLSLETLNAEMAANKKELAAIDERRAAFIQLLKSLKTSPPSSAPESE